VDLSAYRGAAASSATLYAITETVMNRLRELLAEIRGEPAPPLWRPKQSELEPEPEPGVPEEGRR
jgi:hypothetical protein